jgi:hypothetical protein
MLAIRTSQMRSSHEAVTMRDPSRLKATDTTRSTARDLVSREFYNNVSLRFA